MPFDFGVKFGIVNSLFFTHNAEYCTEFAVGVHILVGKHFVIGNSEYEKILTFALSFQFEFHYPRYHPDFYCVGMYTIVEPLEVESLG